MKKFTILFVAIFLFSGCTLTPKGYLKLAKFSQKKNQIPNAIMIYEKIYKQYPNSPEAPEALYSLAKLYHENRDLPRKVMGEKAIYYCNLIIENYKHTDYYPKAIYYKALVSQFKLKDYLTATKSYQFLIKNYPNSYFSKMSQEMLDLMKN